MWFNIDLHHNETQMDCRRKSSSDALQKQLSICKVVNSVEVGIGGDRPPPFRQRFKMRNTGCCRVKCRAASDCSQKNEQEELVLTRLTKNTLNPALNYNIITAQTISANFMPSSSGATSNFGASFSASVSVFKTYSCNKNSKPSENQLETTARNSALPIAAGEIGPSNGMTIAATKITTVSPFQSAIQANLTAAPHLCQSEVLNQDRSNSNCCTHTCNKRLGLDYDEIFIMKNNNNQHKKMPLGDIMHTSRILQKQQQITNLVIFFLLFLLRATSCQGLLVVDPSFVGLSDGLGASSTDSSILNSSYNKTRIVNKPGIVSGFLSSSGAPGPAATGVGSSSSPSSAVGVSGQYLDILDNLERSVAAVIIKVAYGTTSTTKRSISDNSYVPSLTTIATPPLTTLRYLEKSPHQTQINLHHRNYELDLERDHALPTSAPNADILKSNSNPTYPNPNRHHNHDRDRHRHVLNSSPAPSLSNILKKTNNSQSPSIPIYPGDLPSYSPPARSFFTPPLPPEYQNPFADKPTLRGTNNEGVAANTGTYINRRPIPPPSLMPGHERIPFRPPDLGGLSAPVGASAPSLGNSAGGVSATFPSAAAGLNPISSSNTYAQTNAMGVGVDADRKKALNTPSRGNSAGGHQETTTQIGHNGGGGAFSAEDQHASNTHNTRQEVLPSIRRILSGSNGNKGEIPEVLLKQVTSRPAINHHQPPSSPVVLVDSTPQENVVEDNGGGGLAASSNINKSKANNRDNGGEDEEEGKLQPKTKMSTKSTEFPGGGAHQMGNGISSTPAAATALGEVAAAATSTSTTTSASDSKSGASSSIPNSGSSSSSSSTSTAAAAAAHATWAVAWNIHVYLSVILFTILGVYSFYKILTYNKLTHLFSQSYFICIHLILIIICLSRIFYLCYDAYNIHSTFHIFVSEILLNLPATFLTISFSVLILFLFLKSLNHKNNRYSALVRPLTVVVGCGVHVVLCITLHYVESYTMQNHQQHLYYQQQFYRRQQAQQQHSATSANAVPQSISTTAFHHIGASTVTTPPPRVLSLICQIIYIFICLSLGLLYLYIYRILKRILRSKSQNYIHGFQNLSYAIHITIATALLFVLLAALQIFGAISISITRPLITQVTAERDWLQWGYQFSLRLIEIAIITLMAWVAGLKTSGGALEVVVGCDPRGVGVNSAGGAVVFGTANNTSGREKHSRHHHHHHNHHSNVAGFFLPCTSSSSQEQFETDYPAVCNANTNLHTYTMRTGKLIYDDSFALNSLGAGQSSSTTGGVRSADFHLQQPAYQRPYDTGSLHSSSQVKNLNNVVHDFSTQANHYQHHGHHQYSDYLTDATTDHYENPNFELRAGKSSNASNPMQKLTAQTSTASTTASCSGGSGTSAASQQQMLLLQSDSCYSEPIQPNDNTSSAYEFNNFERPKFGGGVEGNGFAGVHQSLHVDGWSDQLPSQPGKNRDKKSCTHLAAYDNPERRSSNSTHSCSSGGGGGRYSSNNSFELGNNNGGVRKSGTLNNISVGGIISGRNVAASASGVSSTIASTAQRASGVQTLASADRYHLQQQQLGHQHQSQRGGRNMLLGVGISRTERESSHDYNFGRATLERTSSNSLHSQQQHALHQNSDDDMMLAAGNAERTNLISNVVDAFVSQKSVADACSPPNPAIAINGNERMLVGKPIQQQLTNHFAVAHDSLPSSATNSASESSTASAKSATSGSMLVADHGFVRFRALEDMNNAQGVGIHNASIRNQIRAAAVTGEQAIAQNS